MDDREDRFGLVENSQSSSHAMFWKTKLGVLVVVTGICALVLITCSSLMISGVSRLRYVMEAELDIGAMMGRSSFCDLSFLARSSHFV